MNVVTRRILVAAVASTAMFAAPLAALAGASMGATVTLAEPGPGCVGDAATLSWTPPADEAGLIGYQIEHFTSWPFPAPTATMVGLDQTTLPVTLRWGPNSFLVRSVTPQGVDSTPFATVTVFAGRAPSPMNWSWPSPNNSVGTALPPCPSDGLGRSRRSRPEVWEVRCGSPLPPAVRRSSFRLTVTM